LKLISFAYDFVSYLLQNFDRGEIDRIFLFGSVIRDEAKKDSDIDIFIDSHHNIQNKVNKILDMFYNSSKYIKYWKPLNVKNEIKVIVGSFENYPDLKRSIISSGLVLYSSFKENISGNNYSLFTVNYKGKFKHKVRLWRKLYGSTQTRNKKTYVSKGIVERNNGRKISKAVFIVPIGNSNFVIKELKKLNIGYKVYDISSDTL